MIYTAAGLESIMKIVLKNVRYRDGYFLFLFILSREVIIEYYTYLFIKLNKVWHVSQISVSTILILLGLELF